MSRVAGILIAFWAGSLWTICAIVAPSLFRLLDNRQLAGQLAGRFFFIETVIGVVVGLALVILSRITPQLRFSTADYVIVAVMAGAPLLSEIVLGPMMSAAREAGNMTRFGMLHGISALLFLIACIGAVALVWRFNRPAG